MKDVLKYTLAAGVLSLAVTSQTQAALYTDVDMVFSNDSGDSITYRLTIEELGTNRITGEKTYIDSMYEATFNIGGVSRTIVRAETASMYRSEFYPDTGDYNLFNITRNAYLDDPGFDFTMRFEAGFYPSDVNNDGTPELVSYLADGSVFDTSDYVIQLDGLLSGTVTDFGYLSMNKLTIGNPDMAVVPVPAAAWLFASGILGLAGIARRKVAA